MKNPFKLIFSRKPRKEDNNKKQIEKIAKTFRTLDSLEEKDLIKWSVKDRRLFIISQLASIMMTDAVKWRTFMDNIFAWIYHREAQDAWEAYILREEAKAVRDAKKKYSILSKAEITAIRQARRDEIMISDIEQPEIKPFQFFISHPNKDEDGTWQMEMIAIGTYNDGNMEFIPWEDLNIKS